MKTIEQMKKDKGLGYHWVYDARAAAYMMSTVLMQEDTSEAPAHILHERGPILDQGREGACVAFGHGAVVNAGPIRPATMLTNQDAFRYYKRAQQLDEWEGENYSGTSNQAGAKAYREGGFYESFVWAANPEEMSLWVRTRGPVAWTCKWRDGMYQTDSNGYLWANGSVVGGHLMACIGINEKGDFIVQNSWGEDFGKGGICLVTPATMSQLYSQGQWTACSPVEIGALPPKPEPPKPGPTPGTLPNVYYSKMDNIEPEKLKTSHFYAVTRKGEKLGTFKGIKVS